MLRISVKSVVLIAFAGMATASLACVSEGNPAAPFDNSTATAQPTEIPHDLEQLTGDELLEHVTETMDRFQSFEATLNYELISPEGDQSAQIVMTFESRGRIHVVTENNEGVMEEIFVQNRSFRRNARTLAEIEEQRWTASTGSYPTWVEFVISIMKNLDAPDETTRVGTDDFYTLLGEASNPRLGASGPPPFTHRWQFDGGMFEAQIAPETFHPINVSFDRHEVFEAVSDQYETFENFITFTVEFHSFNEPVEVSIPAAERIDEAVSPTATATSVPGGAP